MTPEQEVLLRLQTTLWETIEKERLEKEHSIKRIYQRRVNALQYVVDALFRKMNEPGKMFIRGEEKMDHIRSLILQLTAQVKGGDLIRALFTLNRLLLELEPLVVGNPTVFSVAVPDLADQEPDVIAEKMCELVQEDNSVVRVAAGASIPPELMTLAMYLLRVLVERLVPKV